MHNANACQCHCWDTTSLTQEVLQWLGVAEDFELPAKEILVVTLDSKDNGQHFFVKLRILCSAGECP